jgi:SAM-dependent methyltransferase
MSETDEYAVIAEMYDHVVPYRERKDVAFFVEAAKEAGGPVLEVGCGTGRVLIPTAREGVEIAGLDLSPQMLKICREQVERESPEVRSRVRLVEADMRAFSLDRTFRLATLPFRPFQHLLTVEDQLACLACIHRHLEPGGRLVLDVFNPSLEGLTRDNLGREMAAEPEFTMPDGRRVVRKHKMISRDPFQQVIRTDLVYHITHPDGRRERLVHALTMRYFFRFEAEHLLARAGFEVEALYADYDKSPYGSKNPGELIFVARKVPPP